MKTTFILCCAAVVAAACVCFGQASPSEPKKSAAKEAKIQDLEKSAWEAFKNKQADAFKALLSKNYFGVSADGVKDLDAEVAGIAKTELRDYSSADVKVIFHRGGVAVITYNAKQQATSGGQDVSGTYNCGSVWVKEGGKWLGVFHSEAKVP
jgi:uncharacterized protein YpuA (DUF1002 family)